MTASSIVLLTAFLFLQVQSKWQLILDQDTSDIKRYFKSDIAGNAIIDPLEKEIYAFDGEYKYRLIYEQETGETFDKIWTQTSWLAHLTGTRIAKAANIQSFDAQSVQLFVCADANCDDASLASYSQVSAQCGKTVTGYFSEEGMAHFTTNIPEDGTNVIIDASRSNIHIERININNVYELDQDEIKVLNLRQGTQTWSIQAGESLVGYGPSKYNKLANLWHGRKGCPVPGYCENTIAGYEMATKMGDGKYYDTYMLIHPDSNVDSYVEWKINGQYDRFTAVVGPSMSTNAQHQKYAWVMFKFFIDGKLIKSTVRLAGKANPNYDTIELDISGGNTLRIEVDEQGSTAYDHCIVANPMLYGPKYSTSNVLKTYSSSSSKSKSGSSSDSKDAPPCPNKEYATCGGEGRNVNTCCQDGCYCRMISSWHSQCQPIYGWNCAMGAGRPAPAPPTPKPIATPAPTLTRVRYGFEVAVTCIVEEQCYFLEGNPGWISGDPHTMTFAGVLHHFQGQPYNGLKQFYYIHPCNGYNHNDLPYHLIGQHHSVNTKVAGLDYLVLELFDNDDTQYNVFLSSSLHSFIKGTQTNYDGLNAHKTSLVSKQTMKIGQRFKLMYNQVDGRTVHVVLTIDDVCNLELSIIRQNKWNAQLNRWQMHYVRVNPPECYKCAVCGLLGTFQDQQMPDCHGNFVEYGGNRGWQNVWDPRGWTWEVTYTNANCPVLDEDQSISTPSPNAKPTEKPVYVQPPDPSFPFDPCDNEDSKEYKAAETACNTARARSDVNDCCDKIGAAYCDQLNDDCAYDVCVQHNGQNVIHKHSSSSSKSGSKSSSSSGPKSKSSSADSKEDEHDSLVAIVDEYFTEPILEECDDIIVDEEDWEQFATRNPTISPTPEPTAKPTDRPTHRPTTEPTKSPTPTLQPTASPVCASRTLYDSGNANLVPVKNTVLTRIPITDMMHFSMDITVNSIPSTWASVFHCGESNGDRMPGIWIHPNSANTASSWKGFTVIFSTTVSANPWKSSPVIKVGETHHLELILTQTMKKWMLDGVAFYENYNDDSHQLFGQKTCYLSDPWYNAADVVVRNLVIEEDCYEGREQICHTLEGNPSIIWGDPHTTTFAGIKHDFQGQPQNGLDQFYYIHPCYGNAREDLPYNVIGRHFPYRGSHRVSGLDYLAIELFDENDHRYVAFFNSAIHGFIMGENTDYDNIKSSVISFAAGVSTPVGNRFEVYYVQTSGKQITVRITIDGSCKLDFTMIGQNTFNKDLGRFTMHYVRMNPPDCYKCAICGLYGDFQGYEMQTCHGSIIEYGRYKNAWDERGWTWEKTYTNDHCPVLDDDDEFATPSPTDEPYEPPPDPTFPYDPCDDKSSDLKQRANEECELARAGVEECCQKIGVVFCDDLMQNCAWDACFSSEGNEDNIPGLVERIITDPVEDECDELVVDEENYEEHATKSPTTAQPSPAPTDRPTTADPSHSPTRSPTHICPMKQEMDCCCPSCDGTPSHHMLNTCEANSCQYDRIDGNCVSGPGWHQCTAKCATTGAPTAEPTDSPTHDPTKAPTPEPTRSPTKEPTKSPSKDPTISPTREPTPEPTDSPTKEPTKSPTYEPSPSPTRKPTHICPLKQEMDCCCPQCDEAPTHHMMVRCEMEGCQYDKVDGNCVSAPAFHHCTAKCAQTANPTKEPTKSPTYNPTKAPTDEPTESPTDEPTAEPTDSPTPQPTKAPSYEPTESPSKDPTKSPSRDPTPSPTRSPTHICPLKQEMDCCCPSCKQPLTDAMLNRCENEACQYDHVEGECKQTLDWFICTAKCRITASPTAEPTESPTYNPTKAPTNEPTKSPTKEPTDSPTDEPTPEPTKAPTYEPTDSPSKNPTKSPSRDPTPAPTRSPTHICPMKQEMDCCCPSCTERPTHHMLNMCELKSCQYDRIEGNCVSGPGWHQCTAKCATTGAPTAEPTDSPTHDPTKAPTDEPTESPTDEPTAEPTDSPTKEPTKAPTNEPTLSPSKEPTKNPTKVPTLLPTKSPTDICPFVQKARCCLPMLQWDTDPLLKQTALDARSTLETTYINQCERNGVTFDINTQPIPGPEYYECTAKCVKTASPTQEPTDSPSRDPTPSPTRSPTHICPLKQEMDCCCPSCDYSGLNHVEKEKMIQQCEMNSCQFDKVGGNCIRGQGWEQCTAKCATTGAPTAEPTDEPTRSPTACRPRTLYDSGSVGMVPKQNYVLTTVPITDMMHISMHITVNSLPAKGYMNIFHCGDDANDQMPAVYLHDQSHAKGGFMCAFSTNANKRPYAVSPAIHEGETYHLELTVTQTSKKWMMNGVAFYENYNEASHPVSDSKTCYLSNPTHMTADVVVSNIVIRNICTLTDEPTPEPSPSPTNRPTTANPTTANPTTADPTSASPTTSSPTTSNPTTAEPSPSPTAKPTHICPVKQEMNCCCPGCDYSSLDHDKKEKMLLTCERDGCQYDAANGQCVSGPAFHHCTAKCALTASPTPEPTTASPTTAEPTTANPTTDRPTTANPTTAEPTYRPTTAQPTTSDPTSAPEPTSRPKRTPRPIVTRTPRPTMGRVKTPRPIKEKTPRPIRERTPRPVVVRTPRPIKEKTPRPIKQKTPRPTRAKPPRPTKPHKTPRPTKTYIAPTPNPTVDAGWGQPMPSKEHQSSRCCKDQKSEQDCMNNHVNSGETCLWLEKEAPLAKKFGTRCLKESFVRNEAIVSPDVVQDECHPTEVGIAYEAFDIAANEHSIIETFKPALIGYRAYVQIGGLLSIIAVLMICLHATYCSQNKQTYDGYELIEDKVEESAI